MHKNSLRTERKGSTKALSKLTSYYSAPYSKGTLETIRSHGSYNPTTSVHPTFQPITALRRLLTNVKRQQRTQGQTGSSLRSNVPTAWLPISVRQAQNLTRD